MANIGFIGLGHMGLPMAINLLKAGHCVTGFDLQKNALDALTVAGGIAAESLQAAAAKQQIIITMLQNGQQVQEVCFGPTGLFAASSEHTLHIDCSSIDVTRCREIHQNATSCKLESLDAPVSGGVKGAANATLTFMVGGCTDAFNRAHPILSVMGKNIIHAGDAGSGQAAKICNNMILGISMIAVSEAFTLAQHLGLTPQKLFEVVSHASGQCWVMNQYVPVPDVLEHVPANNAYQPGFSAAMMLKDLLLSQQSANEMGIKTPIAHHATTLYQQFNDLGMSHLDFSAIINMIDNDRE